MKLYLIGNGFDIDLGYNTSYKSFIHSKEFTKLIQNNSENILTKFIYSNHQTDTNWVDIEIIIGKYANEVCNDDPTILLHQYNELKNELKLYLKRQESKYDIIQQGQTRAFTFLREINDEINSNSNVVIVNFNFTDTVLNRLKYINGGEHDRSNLKYYHPHGILSTDIAFGVNEMFLDDTANQYSFIKKGYSENYSLNGWMNIFKNGLNISVFGHSLGTTDVDIIKPMFDHFLKNPDINRQITIIDQKDANQIVINRIDQLVSRRINTFKLSNSLSINPY
ncbi:MAG: bacteriophage abortive infection AbiH family protein [Chitinophagaceae bacterium]|nr:bacteriophage abortive infection AbiH family protein [Chitinophagaceae bacterium]